MEIEKTRIIKRGKKVVLRRARIKIKKNITWRVLDKKTKENNMNTNNKWRKENKREKNENDIKKERKRKIWKAGGRLNPKNTLFGELSLTNQRKTTSTQKKITGNKER